MKTRTLNFILILALVLVVTSGCVSKVNTDEPVVEEPMMEEPMME